MTVAIDTGYSLTDPNHARILHDGVSVPFLVDATETTQVASANFAAANVENAVTVDRYKPISTGWQITFDLTGGSQSIDTVCVGGSFIGATVTLQYWTGSAWTSIHDVTPTVGSPIMFLFAAVSASRWRVTSTGGSVPEIYNIKIGNALVTARPFYAGASPARMNRQTDVIGNLTRNGELLGRSRKRTVLQEGWSFQNVTEAWCRANLDGTAGLIQSLETGTAYGAWRPTASGSDVAYIMRGTVSPPTAMGQIDLWQFSLQAEVYSYE